MIIEITDVNGAHIPTPKTFPAKGDKPANTVYEQRAYVHLGGAFPTQIIITLDDHNDAYPVGKYIIDPSSYAVSRYGQLEINRFAFKLKPATEADLKKAS